MDQVTIKANIAAHGVPQNATVTVAETPLIAGAIANGVFSVIDRIPGKTPEPIDPPGFEETDPNAPTLIEDVDLPDGIRDGQIEPLEPGNELANDLVAPKDPEPPVAKRTRRKT
jgi:hypothetical protein